MYNERNSSYETNNGVLYGSRKNNKVRREIYLVDNDKEGYLQKKKRVTILHGYILQDVTHRIKSNGNSMNVWAYLEG